MRKIEFIVDNNKLQGTVISPQKLLGKNPAILFVHGWTSHKKRSYQYAEGLAKLGYLSLLFDMRGHGESEGDINKALIKEFLDDVLAAFDYLSKLEGVDKDDISVVGSSFGSYLGALLTTKRKVKSLSLRVPADYRDEDFNKSKMQRSGSENPEIVAWRAKPKKPDETYALKAINDFNGKVLIIESELDDVVPHQTIQNYIDAVKDKRNLTHIVMKNAPHSTSEGPFRDQVEQILVDWFGENNRAEFV